MMLSVQHTRVLVWLARYKYLCLEQIHRNLFEGKTKRNTEIALQRIEKKGFIKRVKLARSHTLNFGFLCYLTPAGLELVRNESQVEYEDFIKYPVIKPISSVNAYYHRYRLTNFFIQLDKNIKSLPNIKLKTVLTEAGQKQVGNRRMIETKLTLGKVSIIPDMIFVLQNTESLKEAVYMIEIDTGKEVIGGKFETIPKNSLLDKYKTYEKFLESDKWQCQIETSARSFQVLTITEKEKHLTMLSERISENMNYPEYFLGSTFDHLKNSNLFLGSIWNSIIKSQKLLR